MTVDIARFDNNAALAVNGASDSLARLGQWVDAARNAHQLVAPLVDTAFVPDAYKPRFDPRATPEQKAEARAVAIANATAAVLQGLTLGVDPLVALQQIYIIHGRPGMYAKFMVALVQAHGHEVWTEDLTETRAVVCGRRKGSQHTERITITMDMARKAKWTSNAKYQETPQDMLWARAAARVCDRIASDVLKGVASVEEIQDEVRVTAEVGTATRTVSPRRRAVAAVEASTVEEPPLEDEAPAVAAPAEAPPAITSEQRTTLTDLLKSTGRNGRTAAAKHISSVIGRDIAAATDLTEAEAWRVIEALEAEVDLNTTPEATTGQEWPDVAQPPLDGGE